MQILVLSLSLFQSNCILIWDEKTLAGVVFDPGGEPEKVLSAIETRKIQLKGIFLTHGHVDHVAGAQKIKEKTGAKVYLNEEDKPLAEGIGRQCLMFGVPMAPVPVVDSWVKEGDTCTFDALKFKVLHMPGHSPGSVVYQFEEPEALLVAGDLLFAGSIGRMDLPGGNEEQMKKSLERVLTLPDSLVVIPGHGPKTTIGKEKRQNPYLVGGMAGW